MRMPHWFLLALLSTFLGESWAGWENMLVTTQIFTNCPGNESQPKLSNVTLNYQGDDGGFLLSGNLKVTDVISYGAMIEMEAHKCLVANDDTSCRFYHKFVIEFCTSLFQGRYWTRWLEKIEGFGPCPVQPRTYRMNEVPLDFNDGRHAWHVLANPEQYVGHWKMFVKTVYRNKLRTCMLTEGSIKKRRRASKKGKTPTLPG